ncbi:hypothetical protein BCF55_0894 [Hydrogenivirga caldilitoris]|uniref:Uncharacterized protein n=1 Tax=Hydrogenivirga caldilitoris TaxID=246264 RepID=A0A497XNT9_9AQUI|nr:hypothetical protein [Hydrogenivirga caldilitoris]RLJ70617.1 hypothetical protein BCF55_0894 [Hydrogenivirga caldilitoris]
MVDPDILLIAMVELIEGVRNLIGDKGANAVLRDAGRHSGPKLLESLIGHLPEVLEREEALRRTCMLLEELGFAKKIEKEDSTISIQDDIFSDAIRAEDIQKSPVVYFFMGLIEGFVQFMSGNKVTLSPKQIEKGRFVFSYA